MSENLLLIRTKKFATRVVKFTEGLPNSRAGRIYGDQVFRSGTSTYLNYRAAKQARSTAEFISKLNISLEEADETEAWLDLIKETMTVDEETIKGLYDEAGEICAMLIASLKTVKRNNRRN
jgi:four helix bundle protein